MLFRVASISEKLGRITACKSLEAKPQLRRNNRIRSVRSSLRIESNMLPEGTVRAVLDGKKVIGPPKEIQEVKNAFTAYEQIGSVDPYSIDDLKKLHGIMTYLCVENPGSFRTGAEGVFDGDRCIFMAPPAILVPGQMESLFFWMRRNAGKLHPLILSCVFHYEFVFIHPFSDGNGRMARLWQTVLLSAWNEIFKFIPIESQIEKYQEAYYDAIAVSNARGHSDAFIEFMLDMIDRELEEVLAQSGEAGGSAYVRRLLAAMDYDTMYSAADLLACLGLKSREALRKNYLAPAIEAGLVAMTLPDKPTSRNQQYYKK